jgi:hypothetical protein
MKPGKVRPIAICLIILNGKVLLQKGFDVERSILSPSRRENKIW